MVSYDNLMDRAIRSRRGSMEVIISFCVMQLTEIYNVFKTDVRYTKTSATYVAYNILKSLACAVGRIRSVLCIVRRRRLCDARVTRQ